MASPDVFIDFSAKIMRHAKGSTKREGACKCNYRQAKILIPMYISPHLNEFKLDDHPIASWALRLPATKRERGVGRLLAQVSLCHQSCGLLWCTS